MTAYPRINGFSLIEILVAAAILSLWLPSSLYTLQLALTKQHKIEQQALTVESIMALKTKITAQWRQGQVSVDPGSLDWSLSAIDEQHSVLEISDADYQLRFWLTRQVVKHADPVGSKR
ncbi:pilus assembly FimT family protein [Idiomarina seosinensis]|uniref:Uncharacterized protein n=1 Tax=Idiomarina seosinensis TaxID=281739 RepID=A0A432ZIE9_9GAMM|nr:type II secretion system protein [Idiomarina seosinensis]RUO77052.1 hypothetical protein CWI81_00675 [Idiomarina seosinensis]